MNDKIIFIPYSRGYHIHYQEFGGDEKYLGKIRHDSLNTAIWFYRLEGLDIEMGDSYAGVPT